MFSLPKFNVPASVAPMQGTGVGASCAVEWVKVFSCNTKCPYCYTDEYLTPSHFKPTSPLIQALLDDFMLHCGHCNRDITSKID